MSDTPDTRASRIRAALIEALSRGPLGPFDVHAAAGALFLQGDPVTGEPLPGDPVTESELRAHLASIGAEQVDGRWQLSAGPPRGWEWKSGNSFVTWFLYPSIIHGKHDYIACAYSTGEWQVFHDGGDTTGRNHRATPEDSSAAAQAAALDALAEEARGFDLPETADTLRRFARALRSGDPRDVAYVIRDARQYAKIHAGSVSQRGPIWDAALAIVAPLVAPSVEPATSKRGGMMKIYVASSWRNLLQPAIVHALRRCGHEVYDFKNPAPGNTGFRWSDCAVPGVDWQDWTPDEYRRALQHPIAIQGYEFDIGALKACEACVLVLPSGRSASWEFGYAMGQGKRGVVVQFDKVEPELMYREAEIVTSMDDLFDAFGEPVSK